MKESDTIFADYTLREIDWIIVQMIAHKGRNSFISEREANFFSLLNVSIGYYPQLVKSRFLLKVVEDVRTHLLNSEFH